MVSSKSYLTAVHLGCHKKGTHRTDESLVRSDDVIEDAKDFGVTDVLWEHVVVFVVVSDDLVKPRILLVNAFVGGVQVHVVCAFVDGEQVFVIMKTLVVITVIAHGLDIGGEVD
jgi:hypothetical protein